MKKTVSQTMARQTHPVNSAEAQQLKLFEDTPTDDGLISLREIFQRLARQDSELQRFFEVTGVLKKPANS
jgi:hypothetical protein